MKLKLKPQTFLRRSAPYFEWEDLYPHAAKKLGDAIRQEWKYGELAASLGLEDIWNDVYNSARYNKIESTTAERESEEYGLPHGIYQCVSDFPVNDYLGTAVETLLDRAPGRFDTPEERKEFKIRLHQLNDALRLL